MKVLKLLSGGIRRLWTPKFFFTHATKPLGAIPLILFSTAITAAVLAEYYIACFIFYTLIDFIILSDAIYYFATACILIIQSALFFWIYRLNIQSNRQDILLKRLVMAFINGFYSK